jgi:hypothetical protein
MCQQKGFYGYKLQQHVYVCSLTAATTDYIVCTTNIINGVGLLNSILSDTPNFKPEKLWDNQLDDPATAPLPPPPQAKTGSSLKRTPANPF